MTIELEIVVIIAACFIYGELKLIRKALFLKHDYTIKSVNKETEEKEKHEKTDINAGSPVKGR